MKTVAGIFASREAADARHPASAARSACANDAINVLAPGMSRAPDRRERADR